MMKKMIIALVIIVLLIVLIIVGKIVFLSKQEIAEISPTPTVALPTVSGDITVDLVPKLDNKAVILRIKGLTGDMLSIEYELTYITGAGLPRGVLGKIQVRGEKEIVRDDIVLGTCSSGKCVYDTGVKTINLSLKFNSPSGSSIFQKTYSF